MLGVVDWGMAMTFFQHQYMHKSWEELAMTEMGDSPEMESMAYVEAGNMVLWQLMFVFLLQLIAGFIFKKIESRDQTPTFQWQDELFNCAQDRPLV